MNEKYLQLSTNTVKNSGNDYDSIKTEAAKHSNMVKLEKTNKNKTLYSYYH